MKYLKLAGLVIPKRYATALPCSSKVLLTRPIRALFELYDHHGKITDVERVAARMGLRSKRHQFRSGREQGGGPLSTGQIHKILTNPVYLGRIRHKEKTWPGRHPAVIGPDLWQRVQEKLQAASRRRRGRKTETDAAPLTGKLQDETGDRLTPTHCIKAGKRHPYYVSNRLISNGPDPTGWRLPGRKLESAVASAIAAHLEQAAEQHKLRATPDLRNDPALEDRANALVSKLGTKAPDLLRRLLIRGIVAKTITLELDAVALAGVLRISKTDLSPDLLEITAPFHLRRRGVEAKLAIGAPAPKPDRTLLRTLADAHHWAAGLRNGDPIKTVAHDAGHQTVFIRTRGQLAFLSPKIQAAIRDGTQPPELTLKRILGRPVPLDWTLQDRLYGFS
ncbi:recombinase family protein [Ruegeria arenilitoris]|uniref:recombinase family protein n=1 Tax=Ruegeria arenilitoris TaxID=1173585 RepID=UPI00147E5737|nr:recombinase family protein [Ruegeria arenilitoris]